MKKLILTVFSLVVIAGSIQAQSIFVKGDKVINLGIGVGNYYNGSGYKTTIPPISGSFEYGIVDNLFDEKSSIGVGGYLAYTANRHESVFSGSTYGYKYSYFVLGARGAFHYQFVDKLDTYAGVMLGYNIGRGKYYGNSQFETSPSSVGGFEYSLFVGARYYFTSNIAAFAEVGYGGIAPLQLGVTFKL